MGMGLWELAAGCGLRLLPSWFQKDCSVQFKMVSMCSEKPICAPPRLSEVSSTLPLKRF